MPSHRRVAFTVLLALTSAFTVTASATAATFRVNSTSDAVDVRVGDGVCRTATGACTLRAAIQEANARAGADAIVVPAGTYALDIPPSGTNTASTGDHDVMGPLTIAGAGLSATVLDGGPRPAGAPAEQRGLDRLLEVHPTAGDVSLSGLTIREGYSAADGGGIQNASPGTLRLTSVRILDSFAATYGGGVNNAGTGRVELVGSTLSRNGARLGGSAVNNAGSGTVIGTHSTVTGNPGSYPLGAGAVFNQALDGARGTVSLVDSTVSGNVASRSGAGVGNAGDGTVSLDRSTISGNRTSANGGGLYNASGLLSISMTRISGNRARSGGGLFAAAPAGGDGVPASTDVAGSTIAGNASTGGDGGGIAASGTVTIGDSTLQDNAAFGRGGGLAKNGGGPLLLSRSTLHDNVADGPGGGIHNAASAASELVNSTLSGNSSEVSGGALHSDAPAVLRLIHATVFANSAPAGGGISHAAGRSSELLVLRNSIAAGSPAGGSCAGPIGSDGGNLDGDGTCGLTALGDQPNVEPGLELLGDNGGGTHTHALLPDSPAIDRGQAPCPPTDQRGGARPQGAGCDVGAFEAPPDITPPETWIIDAATGPAATFEFTGIDERGDVGFECRLDGGAWTACVSPQLYDGLAPGDHVFEVRAIDAAGNADPSPAEHRWTDADVTAPETAITSAPQATTDGTARFEFTGTDDRGAVTFECRLDGGAWTACTSPQSYEGLAAGDHRFEVRAVDASGNADPTPAEHSWTDTPPDTASPDTTITGAPGSTSDGTATFEFTGSDNRTAPAALSFACRLDDGDWAACTSPLSYEGLAAGRHTFFVRATDEAGNTDQTPAERTWTILPDTEIASAISGNSVATFEFTGGASFECRLDGGDWAACTSPQRYEGLTLADHTFDVRAIDDAGNADPVPASHSWTDTDTIAPSTAIVSAVTGGGAATFEFAGTDDRGTVNFECRVDTPDWTPCTSPQRYDGLAAGEHSFEVRAVDASGNADPAPASLTWIVRPPDTEMTSAVTGNGIATFEFAGGASFECQLDGGGWTPCTSPQRYEGLALAGHGFEVRAIDDAGNGDPSPAEHRWTDTDTIAPPTAITSAVTGAGTASFEFAGTDDRGPVSFECRLDTPDWTPCTSPQTYEGLTDGEHTFEVRAVDSSGNPDPEPAAHTWTVAPPLDTEIASAVTGNGTASFEFGGGVSFECRLDAGEWIACTSPQRYDGLALGDHTFEVRATGDPTPAFHAWTDTDTIAPETTIVGAPPEIDDGKATFGFTGSDDRSDDDDLTFECRLDETDPWAACTSPAEYASLGLGAHAFEVRATDDAGNTDPTPARHAWKLVDCSVGNVTVKSVADAWLDEGSPATNKGSDATMKLQATPGASARVVVRFQVPPKAPDDCVVESAKLRLFAPSGSDGATLEAWRLAAPWQESSVSWGNQPATAGAPGTTYSGEGYVSWSVSAQVQAMFDGAPNHGFLVKDADEGGEGGGKSEFHAREKGENPPLLAIRFGPPPIGTPRPPEPPVDATVSCGEELTRSTRVMNDLTDCLTGDGLVIGAHRIIVDLNGHTVDGVGLGTGIRNDGYDGVIIRNGRVHQWDHGVQLQAGSRANEIRGITAENNEVTGLELRAAGGAGAAGTEVRSNTITGNGDGIALLAGTTGTVVADNAMTLNRGAHLLVQDSDGNRLEGNTVAGAGGGDLGIGIEHSSGNVLLQNTVSETSDGGMIIAHGSNGNRIEDNVLTGTGDAGILVDTADRNVLIGNESHHMSDAGISLGAANDGVVKRNDVSANPGGIQLDGSSRNLIKRNDASETTGIGIEIGGGSLDNDVLRNVANGNGAAGIVVAEDALLEPGNRVLRNTAIGNGSNGIVTAKGGHVLAENVTEGNGGWGINAALGTIDGGGNVARDNREPTQCLGIVCLSAPEPDSPDGDAPETAIVEAPAGSDGTAVLTFTGTDAGTTDEDDLDFECRIDGAGWMPCTSPWTYTGLAAGPHAFAVRGIDAAGNADPTPAEHAWTDQPDRTAPDTTITGAPADGSPRRVSFSFAGTDTGGAIGLTFECQLDTRALWEPCADPLLYTGLATGSHTFRVRAIDGSGNADATPAAHTWTVQPAVECPAAITAGADADAWIDENSAGANKGSDGVLKVQSKAPGDDARTLVRFALATVPAGCVVESAKLRLYAGSVSEGRTLEAVRLAGAWTEAGVTWASQPGTTGGAAAAATPVAEAPMEWDVTEQVQAMLAPGANHGFLIRDADEGGAGFGQGFNSRELSEEPPRLVITFG